MTLSNETGTHISLPAQFSEFRTRARIHEIEPERLTLRETAVVELPAGEEHEIGAGEIDAALDAADVRDGDAVIIRTGWGDRVAEFRGGDRYLWRSPFLGVEGARRLGERLNQADSDLVLLDTAVVGLPARHVIPEWGRLWPRPRPWPSEAAWAYLASYTPDRVMDDWAADHALAAAGVMVVSRVVGCGALPAGRVRIIVAPLCQVRGVGATCRVVAVA
ncbi:MAG TPA: cyclase family protein, partial [Actinomycetota bacterium]|jgi:kynurenine formamidase